MAFYGCKFDAAYPIKFDAVYSINGFLFFELRNYILTFKGEYFMGQFKGTSERAKLLKRTEKRWNWIGIFSNSQGFHEKFFVSESIGIHMNELSRIKWIKIFQYEYVKI